jgi:hypothetical protein
MGSAGIGSKNNCAGEAQQQFTIQTKLNYNCVTNVAPRGRGCPISKEGITVLVMDLEETEDMNDCAGEGQQQFN